MNETKEHKEQRGMKPTQVKYRVAAAKHEILQIIFSNPWINFMEVAKMFNINNTHISLIAKEAGLYRKWIPEVKKYKTTKIGE